MKLSRADYRRPPRRSLLFRYETIQINDSFVSDKLDPGAQWVSDRSAWTLVTHVEVASKNNRDREFGSDLMSRGKWIIV